MSKKPRDESLLRITDAIIQRDNPEFIAPFDFLKGGKFGSDSVEYDQGLTRWAKFKDAKGQSCLYGYNELKDAWIHMPMGG